MIICICGGGNSNPLLHTSRLYSLWKDWKLGMSYDRNPGFYSEWTIDASILYIAMDEEFQQLLCKLGLKEGFIPSVLKYYESKDAEMLTKKISPIPAFQGIPSSMEMNKVGMYEPDFRSRYFSEVFSYGLKTIYELVRKENLENYNIKSVYKWCSNYI